MRQGQQNRRGRGRGGSNNTNPNRKPQNPLSRTYDSSGPDVKIRGTASQIAEKYSTLARDASSSGDVIMAENYLQHAEHYNRIIMAAQAQAPQQPSQNGSDPSHAMNGAHRGNRDANGTMREQPQPHMGSQQPSEQQPNLAEAGQPTGDEPQLEEVITGEATVSAETNPESGASRADSDEDPGRRRRRRYPGSTGNGTKRPAAETDSKEEGGNVADTSGEDRSSDEATA